jgi:TPR repeat protein
MLTPKFAILCSLVVTVLTFVVLTVCTKPALAANDDGSADVSLGVKYLNGDGVTKDLTKALHYFQLAAALGNANGENNLGVMYDKGMGVPVDYATALHWFQLAAAQGNANAEYAIGVIYDDGHGVSQDYAAAMKHYLLAADKGVAPAQNGIGILYYEGHGVSQDYAQALHWFGLATKQNYSVAEDNVGLMYEQGNGVPQVYQIASYWDQLAVTDGDADAASDVHRVQDLIAHFPLPQLPCETAPTSTETLAVSEVKGQTYTAAFSDFMKALYSREACVPKTTGAKQAWNIYFAGFDEWGLTKATGDDFTRSYFLAHAHTIAGNLLKADLASDLHSFAQDLWNNTK